MYSRIALLCFCVCVLSGCKRASDRDTPKPVEPVAGEGESVNARYLTTMNIGKAQCESGSAKEAIRSFEAAVELLPTEVAARLNLARACLLDSAFERTVSECSLVIEIDRYATSAYYLSGLAYLRLGRAAEATAKLQRAARDDPSTAAVQFQLGAALLMDGQPERAGEAFRAAVQLEPGHWSAHYKLATIAQRAKDPELYRTHMQTFQALRENMPERQQAADYWQRCKHTAISVPSEVHQPDEAAIAVRFVPKPLGIGDAQFAPLASGDFDDDGRNDVVAVNAAGEVHVLHNTATSLSDVEIGSVGIGLPGSLCRVADFDNSGGSDVFVGDGRVSALLSRGDDGSYTNVTRSAGLSGAGILDATWVDFDHDADVDLLAVNGDNTLTLWVNRGNGTFVDGGADVGVPSGAIAAGVWPADMDSDEQTDVVVMSPDGPCWQLHNDGLGEFETVHADPPWPTGTLLIVEDFDNDLSRDVVVAQGNAVNVRLSGGGAQAITIPHGEIVGLVDIDYDNDGWLDLGVVGGDGEFRLFRNGGAGGWVDVSDATALSATDCKSGRHVIVADMDGDGDSDLLFNDSSDRLTLLSNEGGNANAQLRLRLTGTKSNKSALGTLVELSAGSFRLSRTVTRFPVEIGVGSRSQLDSVRTIWPNGIVKHDIWVDPSKPLRIEEPFVSAGSCPYVYAWDGESFRFITDILGSSPLGLSLRRGAFVEADTEEYIWVGNDQTFVKRGGRYALQITDELREILYLDHVSLVAVDHPADQEAHPTSKVQPPPFVDAEVWVMGRRQEVLNAVDSDGRDWTDALRSVDGVRTRPPVLEKPQLRGRAVPYSLELDFEPIDVSKPLALVLTGWLMWGDAGVNVATAQNPDSQNPWPALDAWAGGAWQSVSVEVGTPSGKTKSIIVDLAGRLPVGTTRLRLTTGYELYWDRIALFERIEAGREVVTRLEVTSADLGWRGFPAQIRPDPSGPVLPDVDDIRNEAPWRRGLSGWCTRYGDISELLRDIDDRYAILNGGDGVIVEFAGELPPLAAGYTRDFFMFCDGWDKDGDYNVAFGDTVKPLPFHGMDAQRYGAQRFPDQDAEWIRLFNTRWVGQSD